MSDDSLEEEEALGRAYDLRLLRRLWRYVRPYGWQVALTLVMVVPLFAMEIAPAWIIKTGLDHATGSEDVRVPALQWIFEPPAGMNVFVWLGCLYLCVMVGGSALRFAHMILMATTGQSAMRDLRRDVFDHIQALPLRFFDRFPVGRLVTRATNDVENVAEMFSSGIVALVTDVLMMIGLAVILWKVDATLALWTFSVIPFLAVAAIIFRFKVRQAFRAVRVRIARINAHIQETITGMKVVQLFTREERNLRDFDRMNADHRDAWKLSIRYDALLFASVEAAQGLTIAIIIWVGTGDIAKAGVLYIFIDYMRRFFMPLRDLSQKYSVMQSSMASSERIFQLLDTEPEITDPLAAPTLVPAVPAAAPRGPSTGAVEFDHVWFAYGAPEAEQGGREPDWVLRDVSFRVAPGEKAAFVGATGAGKTTLIKLLTRLYDVTRGRILVDGVDIREIAQADLRRRVATVLQDVFLFSGTVTDNIALGRSDLRSEDILEAARAVEIERFVQELPDGFETEVRERGTNFSSGQRQLLSFARALVHGADILVLDEATSSIDTETEALVQRGIHLLLEGRTAIAIAHRLSTIRDMDTIHVLHRGRLVESGRHEELLAADGVYRRLYLLQHEDEPDAVAARAMA